MNYTLKNNGNKHSAITFNPEQVKEAVNYWTKERMEQAIPEVNEVLPESEEKECVGEAVSATAVSVADTKKSPFNAGGKLFYTKDGTGYVASAEFCGDKQIILTAAHCFYNRRKAKWAENIVFKRCYCDGTADQVVGVQSVAVDTRYITDADYHDYDYAFGATEDAATGEVLGYEINSKKGTAIAYGYPTNYEGGQKMVYTEGGYSKHDKGNILEMLGNSMGGGCSGGAWVKSGTNKAISVNSFSYTSRPDDQYGPLFTSEFEALFAYAKTLIVPANSIRYFKLHNSGAFVVHMQILWRLGDKSGTYEEDGYHDICAAAERTIDMVKTGIPEGATVRLKGEVVSGDDDTADEEFIFCEKSEKMASYKITGTVFKSKISLE
ncbi:MAG: hypothetical protein Q4D76_10995 [Oscillospiraceae bacterium]|nr:S1 family peptidase [Oscillospiraceae bacterium]MDO5149909.1 hypothetical protein [Oscillospiraceae bacterium]